MAEYSCPACGNPMIPQPSRPGYYRCKSGTLSGKDLDAYGCCWFGTVDVPKEALGDMAERNSTPRWLPIAECPEENGSLSKPPRGNRDEL